MFSHWHSHRLLLCTGRLAMSFSITQTPSPSFPRLDGVMLLLSLCSFIRSISLLCHQISYSSIHFWYTFSHQYILTQHDWLKDVSFMMQFITFGFACTPLYFVWEKVIGMHDTKSICLRALARLPVVIPIWFLAIIFPFFGPINSAVGALLVSFTVYIIPSLAHMLTYRKASARQVT